MNNAQFEANFYEKLPHKPYCSNDLTFGLIIRAKKIAVKNKYIQANPPVLLNYLLFDVDSSEAAMAWHDAGLPPPFWTAQNPENGHAHICYALRTPICTSELASLKPIKYAAAIQAAYAKALNSDTGYSRLITKNPLHEHWRVFQWSDRAYSLDYLADFVDLATKPTTKQAEQGLGRNVTIFDSVRLWAYKHVRQYNHREAWRNAVYAQIEAINSTFPEPLPYSEIKSTAKSISNWVWDRFDIAASDKRFSDKQKARRAKGNGRPKTTTANGEPWIVEGVSRSTWYRMRQKP